MRRQASDTRQAVSLRAQLSSVPAYLRFSDFELLTGPVLPECAPPMPGTNDAGLAVLYLI